LVVLVAAALALLPSSVLLVPAARAGATITVDTTNDENNTNGKCSLREAVEAANTDAAVDSCTAGSGTDTIVFDASTNGTAINLTLGSIELTSSMTIDGNGRSNTIVTGDEFDTSGGTSTIQDMTLVLVNNEAATVTVDNVTATDEMNNNSTGSETSTMTITNSTLSDINNNSGNGASVTTLTITGSTMGAIDNNSGFGSTTHMTLSGDTTDLIDNNSGFDNSVTTADISDSSTGEIDNNASDDSSTTVTVTDTTITGDGGSDGVDVENVNSHVTITGTTITNFDEGVFTDGTTTIVNSTISGNVSETVAVGGGTLDITNSTLTDSQDGIDSFGGTVTVTNTILSDQAGEGSNCDGQVNSGGGNISDDDSCGFNQANDLNDTDPQIGPLADNGGPTQTHLPQTGSPAIDGGLNDPCPSTDQRGETRPQDGDGNGSAICDVGAVEVSGGAATGADLSVTKTDSPDPVLVGGDLVYTIKATNHGPESASNASLSDTLPSGETFVSVVTDTGSCDQSEDVVTCSLGTMESGAVATITLTVTADAGGTLKNTATVTSDTEDPNGANNSATASTTVNPVPTGGVQTGAGGTAGGSPLLPVAGAIALATLGGLLALRRRRSA
jgi:CSLREA domain-containing protein/MYXO-CTERM domain-containing protein